MFWWMFPWTQFSALPGLRITARAVRAFSRAHLAPETRLAARAETVRAVTLQTGFVQTFHITLFTVVSWRAERAVARQLVTRSLTVLVARVLTMGAPGTGHTFDTITMGGVTLLGAVTRTLPVAGRTPVAVVTQPTSTIPVIARVTVRRTGRVAVPAPGAAGASVTPTRFFVTS